MKHEETFDAVIVAAPPHLARNFVREPGAAAVVEQFSSVTANSVVHTDLKVCNGSALCYEVSPVDGGYCLHIDYDKWYNTQDARELPGDSKD